MGLTPDQTKGFRQSRILQMVSQPGGATSSRLAEYFRVDRGQIVNDIRDLRAQGYPIQTSSMTTEGGMYMAVFEMPRIPKMSSQNTPAASAE